MHFLWIGILLGMGVAIPIGPVNLEMIRRNLRFGTPYGIVLGLGACSADITYLSLLCFGALSLLQYPQVLKIFGLGGSALLAWFALSAFRTPVSPKTEVVRQPSLLHYSIEGYLITLFNPFTILFWASLSSNISIVAMGHHLNAIILTGLGVTIGTVGWVISLNTILHFTRHRLTSKVMTLLNYSGGFILLGFAINGFIKALT